MLRRELGQPIAIGLVAAALGTAACDGSTDGTPADPPSPVMPLQAHSPWPKFRANALQNGRTEVVPNDGVGSFWTLPTGKGIFSTPVVGADNRVYVGSADRYFYAIDPDGTIAWQRLTGEIIDSSALLDDQGRVYFGSGDGTLYALDAETGDEVWTMQADDPSVNDAFIRWFEGNVAIGPSGTLYVPNDNFFLYAVERDSGEVKWRFETPDQTWSLPAVDVTTETIYFGNNNVVSLLGDNTFCVDVDGELQWSLRTLGTIAASPLLTGDGKMVVGGFDGFVRAYTVDGEQLWEVGTRDHIYASPGQLSDGTIIQPSADGTIYALDPETGAQRWAFDTREPIRSSPAIDGEDHIYVGSGEGRLFVLNPDGTLRWAMQLITVPRNDLNASPALGNTAVYIAGESGEIFSVPYDYCLRDEAQSDDRCSTGPGEDLPDDGAFLYYTSNLGALSVEPPAELDPNQPLTFSLVLRAAGDTVLALLDTDSVAVTVEPSADIEVVVSADGRFVTITPNEYFVADSSGEVSVRVTGDYRVDPDRHGLAFSGGTLGGSVDETFEIDLRIEPPVSFPLPVATAPGEPTAVWEMARLALPTPAILPSYNQIGFDSLHYLLGLVELDGEGNGVVWLAGAKLAEDENRTIIDPETKALMPLSVAYRDGWLTLQNQQGLSVEVMTVVIPLDSFRIAAHLGADGDATDLAHASGSTICGEVELYGEFMQLLGLCNPQTDRLSVAGAAVLTAHEGGSQSTPAGAGQVAFALAGDDVTATLTGSSLQAADHALSILLIDDATGLPVSLDYGLQTTTSAGADGSLQSVSIDTDGATLPAAVRAYLMVDTYPAARATLQ
ncbi:MAG: PQQ-like beta-propeller repeat protein [Deltaproteobacteria bacterium]|jgi:outer membrane protein assembly factor BamB|nr:PQQ-like beta-propeller repeat protein [Deltaproteobacteria bacterium]MBW2531095.1 PQQ-like beta-propeller repeat protein [Deltaproteobacteria bacterium]